MTNSEISEIQMQYRELSPNQRGQSSIEVIAELHGREKKEIIAVLGDAVPPKKQRRKSISRVGMSMTDRTAMYAEFEAGYGQGKSDSQICKDLNGKFPCASYMVQKWRHKTGRPALHTCRDGGLATSKKIRERKRA